MGTCGTFPEQAYRFACDIPRKEGLKLDGKTRKNIHIGALVDIVLKKDQPTGKRTRGHVHRILTKSPTHPHGIKVMLEEDNQVGRVQEILDEA